MRILAIETSCDETAIALLEAQGDFANAELTVLGDALYSQVDVHREFGGVYPNLAKREHAANLVPLLVKALRDAGMYHEIEQPLSPEQVYALQELLTREPELFTQLISAVTLFAPPDIDAIAVTRGPGLEPALWVGINFARALSYLWRVPLIGVDHMEGHILSGLARETDSGALTIASSDVTFPVLALLISGGHTELVLMRDWLSYEVLGATVDDAVGEAFDKVARLLDLPYPGGPEISKRAQEARERGDTAPFSLPTPMHNTDDYRFSYAGLKTAVRYRLDEMESLSEKEVAAVARSFEDAATIPLVAKTQRALSAYTPGTLIVAGGVSANAYIREQIEHLVANEFPETELRIPPPRLSTDNAIMIGIAGYFRILAGERTKPADLIADGNATLDTPAS